MASNRSGRGKYVTNEAVVTYDIMWEAANRLQGLYVQEVGDGGMDDPVISKMRALVAEVEAIDIDDTIRQRRSRSGSR